MPIMVVQKIEVSFFIIVSMLKEQQNLTSDNACVYYLL